MKKTALLLGFICATIAGISQPQTIYIGGQVTDVETGGPVSDHLVFAALNDSLGYFTFVTDMNGYYGDTIYINTVDASYVHVYTFDCLFMMHDTLVTDLSAPVNVDFAICTTIMPPDCWASFFYYPDSLDFLTWHFIDQSGGSNGTVPDAWFWDFGDGAFSTEQNPTHTYAYEGIYMVCLTITIDELNCENTLCLELMVMGGPMDCQAWFYYYPADSLNEDLSFQFIDNSIGIHDNWLWEFGDGNISSEQNPVHTYESEGTYMVCLAISDSTGDCQSTFCMEVWAGIILPPTGCENHFTWELADPLTYTFYGEAMYGGMIVQADSYLWDFGDGTSGEGQVVTHTFSGDDPMGYMVCLTTIISDPAPGDSCYAVSCQEIGSGGNNDLYTLFGQVIMGNAFADVALVSLYMLAPDGQMFLIGVQPVDSAGHYAFPQVGPGDYYILAELLPGSSEYGNYLPTYYENAITWTEADMISLEEPVNPYNIYMVSVSACMPGSGTITGTINLNYGLFRDGEPASDVEIILLNHNDQAILYVYSTDLGTFDFSALGWGTYKVHAEVPGKLTSHAMVILDEEHQAGSVEFTITATEVYGSLSIHEPTPVLLTVGTVYPNPAADVAMVPITLSRTTILSLRITDQLGRSISGFSREYAAGSHLIEIGTAELPAGVYMLEIRADDSEITIQKIVK